MTDRYSHITVALEQDMREDDAQALLTAIRQLRGVLAVEPHVTSPAVWIATERARSEMGMKLHQALYGNR